MRSLWMDNERSANKKGQRYWRGDFKITTIILCISVLVFYGVNRDFRWKVFISIPRRVRRFFIIVIEVGNDQQKGLFLASTPCG